MTDFCIGLHSKWQVCIFISKSNTLDLIVDPLCEDATLFCEMILFPLSGKSQDGMYLDQHDGEQDGGMDQCLLYMRCPVWRQGRVAAVLIYAPLHKSRESPSGFVRI